MGEPWSYNDWNRQPQHHARCDPCNKNFSNHYSLEAHLRSSIHQQANIRCPLTNCQRSFTSPANLISHWESSSCSSGMTRQRLDAYIRTQDASRAITNPRYMITNSDQDTAITTPYIASQQSWNAQKRKYECYFCHKLFNHLPQLNQHLASPKHTGNKLYRCPQPSCYREFSVLSGLAQHIENGRCGVQKFQQVQNAMQALTRGPLALTYH
ncbi:hypothetical protein T439DRAFT_314239 [Meredithblackwellia eburnea MCA 4105]